MDLDPPAAEQLLEAWERAGPRRALERPLVLLEMLGLLAGSGPATRLSLGERDRRLLALHERLFGPTLACTADCPRCGDTVEFEVPVSQVRIEAPLMPLPLRIEAQGFAVTCRLPDTGDLLAASLESDPAAARRRILTHCLLSKQGPDSAGEGEGLGELPEAVVEQVAQALAEADPQTDVNFRLACPTCERDWESPFEIGAYLWIELQVWASCLLREVHELAAAYGWSESEILRLSATRRQAYLELVRA